MKITKTEFKKGLKGQDSILEDGLPQIAFVGRSNVGKSSLINTLTNTKGLARASSFPGRTQELNVFLINNKLYFIDLPGYGFARGSNKMGDKINKLLYWYLFDSKCNPKVFLIIDAEVGPTKSDLEVFGMLKESQKQIIVVANKIDKIKKSEYQKQMKLIEEQFQGYKIIPFSSKAKTVIGELSVEIFDKA